GKFPLHRADHTRRAVLPGHEPNRRGSRAARREAAQCAGAPMTKPEAGNSQGTSPMGRFADVRKCYGTLTVLDDLDLDIAANEKVAIIGPSGSGKTTVLRMLMTLERIDGGVIWVDGEPMTHIERDGQLVAADQRHLRRVRAKIGIVFQQFNLF